MQRFTVLAIIFLTICFTGYGQNSRSVFLGHALSVQRFVGSPNNTSFNSTGVLAYHAANGALIGAVFSLNSMLGVGYNESGFLAGYSDDRIYAVSMARFYQSSFEIRKPDFSIAVSAGYTWEIHKRTGFGPVLTAGRYFGDGSNYFISIGFLLKQLKP